MWIIVFITALLIAYQAAPRIIDWIRFQSIGTRDYIQKRLTEMNIDIPPEKILLYQVAGSLLLGALVFTLCLPSLKVAAFFGLLSAGIGWLMPKPVVDYLYQRRVKQFVDQMVDALGLMSNGMKAGLSVIQAMGLVTQEMPSPIQEEFSLLLNQNRLGASVEECFIALSKKVVSDEVEMFVTSVNILKETGGNLAETFDTITVLIRERIKVEGKIRALTASAFWQGMILMCVPPFMAVVMSQSDPETMAPMFETPLGWAMLAGVVLLEVIAYFVIRKITTIDV